MRVRVRVCVGVFVGACVVHMCVWYVGEYVCGCVRVYGSCVDACVVRVYV